MGRQDNEDLLLGMFAIQLGFLDAQRFIEASRAWMLSDQKALSDILVAKKLISQADRDLLLRLVRRHVEQSGSIEQSLEEITKQLPPSDFQSEVSLKEIEDTLPPHWLATIERLGKPPKEAPHRRQAANLDATGRFQIVRNLASGGLGKVSVAQDRELDREVALKEILGRVAHRPEAQSRFITEARVTGSLEHPGVVPIYAMGYFSDGRPYYTMRLIRGKSLAQCIKEGKVQELQGAVYLQAVRPTINHLIDACNTIAYAHSRGVLHRDIKPANIMLGKYGETLVVDWGLAKADESVETDPMQSEMPVADRFDSSSEPTEFGTLIGTPSYMSPEQANGRVDLIDLRSDVFSLGATLYHILTGHAPFEGASREDIVDRARQWQFQPPRELQGHIPVELQSICMQAMAKSQSQRYPSAKDLAEDLDRWIAGEPVHALPEGVIKRGLRLSRRHQGALVSGLLMSVLGLAGMTWLYRETKIARDEEKEARIFATQSRELASSVIENFISQIGDDELAQVPELDQKRLDILRSALDEIDEHLAERPGDVFFKMERGNILLRIGNRYRLQGMLDEAIQHLSEIPKIIDSVPESIRNATPRERDDWDALSVDSHYYLAEVSLSKLEQNPSDGTEAKTWAKKCTALAKSYFEGDEEAPEGAIGYARSLNLEGKISFELKDLALAQTSFESSVAVLQPWVQSRLAVAHAALNNDDIVWRNLLLTKIEALFMLAKTHQAAGDLSAASTRLKRAVELNRYLLQTDTGKRDGAKFETQLNELLDALNRNTNDPLK
jgi:eukaryotic-like serine/threonine-protein kinase